MRAMFIRLASVQYKAPSIGRGAAPGKSKSGAVVKKKKKTLPFLVDRRLAEDEADCTNSLNKEETNYILKCNQRAVIDIDDKLFGAGNEISNDNETDFVSFFFAILINRSKGFQQWDRFANGLAENSRR